MRYSQTRLEEMFFTALELAPSERQNFVNRTCENDSELRQKLNILLSADQSADANDFLHISAFEENAASFAPDFLADGWIGKTVGHYEILERIGAGGMGVVYLAKRADGQFEKRVAIKIIKRGMDSEAILTRFLRERQILANLEHPNIARLLDAGMTDDGLPFLVMERVEGVPIDEFCRANRLSINERLELFLNVCAAVSYAHQILIVHRDLKHSNILVTADGVPKLLDFGIAKLLVSDEAENLTTADLRVFTPEYASPEQVRGEIITTASDTYSLGIILYEILTGNRPFSFDSGNFIQIVRAVCETEPERPSLVVSRASQIEDENLTFKDKGLKKKNQKRTINPKFQIPNSKSLKGDLDNIILKSLQKEPARRYSSVEKFADDIRRHLEGLPVSARRDTIVYRAEKFIRRNRIAAVAAGLIFLALVGGIAATSYQAVVAGRERARAERRSENLRKISNSFVVELHDEIIKLPGSLPARQMLLQRGIEQLDALAAESEGNAELQNELAQGYYNLGEMPDLNLADIERNHQKGIAIYKALLEREPENSQYRVRLARGFSRLANVQKMRGDIAGALDFSRQAIRILEAVVADEPTTPEFQTDLFTSYYETAVLLNYTGEAQTGLETARRAFALAEKLARLAPENKDYKEKMSHSRSVIAASLTYLGDYENALVQIRAASAESLERHLKQPENVIHRYGLWAMNRRTGVILAADGQTVAALESLEIALGFIEKLAAESPNDDGHQRNMSYTHLTLGQILVRAGQFENALPHLRRALGLSEKLIAKDPEKGETVGDLSAIHSNLGEALVQTGSRAEGLRHLRESLAFYEKSRVAVAGNVVIQRDYAETLARLGAALANDSNSETSRRDAAEFYRRSLEIWLTMREKGILSVADADKPDQIAKEIEKYR